MKPTITADQREAVWAVLIDLGAHPDTRGDFDAHWPACHEYRFMGLLGSGGKVWADWSPTDRAWHFHVTCYPEDRTPERTDLIASANDHLRRIDGSTDRG